MNGWGLSPRSLSLEYSDISRRSPPKGLAMLRLFSPLTLVAISLVTAFLLGGCSSAETRALNGDDHMSQGQHALALREYQVARRKNPGLFDIDRKIRGAQIAIYFEQGDRATDAFRWHDAERAYGEIRRLDPNHVNLAGRLNSLAIAHGNWFFDRGQRAMAQGNPTGAIHEFEQALAHHPAHPRAADSIVRAEREVAERRDRAELAYREGLAARDSGDLALALRRFDAALLLDSDHPGAALESVATGTVLVESYIAEGSRAAERGEWTQALTHFERALETNPRHPGLGARVRIARQEVEAAEWVASGEDALAHNDFERAHTCFERAMHLTTAPEEIEGRFLEARDGQTALLLAQAKREETAGRIEGAIVAYRGILAIHPDHPTVGELCTNLEQRFEDAEESFLLGQASFEEGDLFSARDEFERCLDSISGFRDVPARLSEIAGALALAEGLYERACLAQADGKLRRARILFEECIGVTRPFRDVDERLAATRSEVFANPGLPGRYDEGCRAQAERDFVRAVRCFDECEIERPGAEDVSTRLEDLRSTVARAQVLYTRGVKAESRCDLESARASLAECLELCHPFRDARERLDDIQAYIRMLNRAARFEGRLELVAARQLYLKVTARFSCHQGANRRLKELDQRLGEIAASFQSMQQAEAAGEYRKALGLALGIRTRCRPYRDLEIRVETLVLEADYADAIALEAHGNSVRAGRIFRRLAARAPQFRDVAERARKSHDRSRPKGR